VRNTARHPIEIGIAGERPGAIVRRLDAAVTVS